MAITQNENEVVAAILAAVTSYLEEEQKPHSRAAIPSRKLASVVNLWGISGREEMMRMRTLWQRRMASNR